jgi:hypothetical protein
MSEPDITLEQFIAMPEWERTFWRRFGDITYPPDSELPEAPVRVQTRKGPMEQKVYFIQAGDGPIKIGVATNPKRRLAVLQTANPHPLKLLATKAGGAWREIEYHSRFAAHRLQGEWFSPHPDILAEIAEPTGELIRE